LGIVTDANEVHSSNARLLILVTELGIVTDANEVHPPNARSLILVTESPIITPIRVPELGIPDDKEEIPTAVYEKFGKLAFLVNVTPFHTTLPGSGLYLRTVGDVVLTLSFPKK